MIICHFCSFFTAIPNSPPPNTENITSILAFLDCYPLSVFLPEIFSRLWITDSPLISTSTSTSQDEICNLISLSKFEFRVECSRVHNRSTAYICIPTILHILSQWSLETTTLKDRPLLFVPSVQIGSQTSEPRRLAKGIRCPAWHSRIQNHKRLHLLTSLHQLVSATPLLLLPRLGAPFPSSSLPLFSSHRRPPQRTLALPSPLLSAG